MSMHLICLSAIAGLSQNNAAAHQFISLEDLHLVVRFIFVICLQRAFEW